MQLARVIGTVVATVKNDSLRHRKLLVVQSLNKDLKPQGKEVLAAVAEVVRSDKDLNNRYFLVAGHTDNVKYPQTGYFKDNWGLSLMRARQVTLFLVSENKPNDPKGPKKPTIR